MGVWDEKDWRWYACPYPGEALTLAVGEPLVAEIEGWQRHNPSPQNARYLEAVRRLVAEGVSQVPATIGPGNLIWIARTPDGRLTPAVPDDQRERGPGDGSYEEAVPTVPLQVEALGFGDHEIPVPLALLGLEPLPPGSVIVDPADDEDAAFWEEYLAGHRALGQPLPGRDTVPDYPPRLPHEPELAAIGRLVAEEGLSGRLVEAAAAHGARLTARVLCDPVEDPDALPQGDPGAYVQVGSEIMAPRCGMLRETAEALWSVRFAATPRELQAGELGATVNVWATREDLDTAIWVGTDLAEAAAMALRNAAEGRFPEGADFNIAAAPSFVRGLDEADPPG